MRTDKEELAGLVSIFADYPEIKSVYFFGSKAEGKEGVLSDFDFVDRPNGKLKRVKK